MDNGVYVNLLAELGAYTKKYFNRLNLEFIRRYLYDAVHEACLGKGVLVGGNLVECLGRYYTPLTFRGYDPKDNKAE